MTYTFTVLMDLHEGETPVRHVERVALALERVIRHSTEVDIEGAEILDSRWGQITVRVNDGEGK